MFNQVRQESLLVSNYLQTTSHSCLYSRRQGNVIAILLVRITPRPGIIMTMLFQDHTSLRIILSTDLRESYATRILLTMRFLTVTVEIGMGDGKEIAASLASLTMQDTVAVMLLMSRGRHITGRTSIKKMVSRFLQGRKVLGYH